MKFIADVSKAKLRGGFYTPKKIVDFILRWAVNGNKNYDILEPSCGDGVFLEQIKKNNLEYNSVTAIEFEPIEARKSKKIKLNNCEVFNEDFFKFCNKTKKRFNLVVGNPPYIRYQFFKKDQREEAEKIFEKANLKYSKLTNAWVSFVVGSSLLLKENEIGKIGFVLPAEILQVSYAKQLREFLAHFYNKINIVSFKKLVFNKIQQEVILLLCEKRPGENTHLIEHLEVNDAEDLNELDVSKLKSPSKKIDFKNNKWTFYFLDQKEIDFLEGLMKSGKVKPLKDFVKVEVGMTTGSNEFFTVPKDTIIKYNLKEYAKPLIGRSVQVTGNIFTKKDWKDNFNSKARSNLLLFPSMQKISKNKEATNYVMEGEKKGLHKWYKNRIRDEWQIVPSSWISDALFIRRNNLYPRLILNESQAYTTDTMHRVSIKDTINKKALIASYYNSLSFAFAELKGRSHGGGVLELMPNEAEEIFIPYSEENKKLLKNIDKMLREKVSIDKILKFADKEILLKNKILNKKQISLINSIWKKLQSRRLNRGKKS